GAGILGMDVLEHYTVLLDFAGGRLVLYRGGLSDAGAASLGFSKAHASDMQSLPRTSRSAHSFTMDAPFDTGAQMSRIASSLADILGTRDDGKTFTLYGTARARAVDLPSSDIAGWKLQGPLTFDAPYAGSPPNPAMAPAIGMDILSRFSRVLLDIPHNRAWFGPPLPAAAQNAAAPANSESAAPPPSCPPGQLWYSMNLNNGEKASGGRGTDEMMTVCDGVPFAGPASVFVSLGGFGAAAHPIPSQIGQTRTRPKDGAVMVAVPAGEFTMGADDCGDDAKPPHKVYLDAYWIDKNDVTVAQYRKFCKATGRQMPSAPDWGWQDDDPMVNVTWDDAKAYCDWAGAALPTEAQWEKAAQGIDGRTYPWGNTWDSSKLWCSVNSKRSGPDPVGSFPAGASPYGCLDMAGNVCQWCADWFGADDYRAAAARNPTGSANGRVRVMRGGSWGSDQSLYRCAYRFADDPGLRGNFVGFRCVAPAGSPLLR
ncbi:MAG TPA: SUMF1/EgtB/PvdO family nonheme iron enzyme, partial [Armatimonadota bacterium]|nr:SUMF1/EgtB/PvdO family nonheme iron enzyme [Armatimonadota bacterium]